MEVGTLHKVVEYRFAQKVTRLRVNRYLNDPQVKLNLHWIAKSLIQFKQKRSPATDERCLHSNELFIAI